MSKQNHASTGAAPPGEHLIAQYAMACLQGAPDPGEWADLQRHLAICPECQAELDDLLLMLADTGAANLAGMEAPDTFDLAALPPWLPPIEPEERPGGAFLIVERALDQAFQIALDLGAWLGGAAASGAGLAGALRAAGPPDEHHHKIYVDRPSNLDVALDMAVTDPEQGRCRLKVTVIEAHDPFAQGGHRVTLQYESQIREAISDTRGCVVFAEVPCSALQHLQLTVHLCEPDQG
jgi:hypothetical protein